MSLVVALEVAAASPHTRATLGVGFLGGFTTFSTWSVQAFLDVEAGEPLRAAILVLASVILGLLAAAAGYYLSRAIGHRLG